MYKKLYTLNWLMAGIFSMLAIVSCQEPISDEDGKSADHTLLMYMIGDNNLTSYLETNVRQASTAILDSVSSGKLNLVIYKDNMLYDDNLPQLYWVHLNENLELEKEELLTWDSEIDSCDPEIMAQVIKTVFSRFDTKIKGMVFACHAAGWVPLVSNRSYNSPRRNAIGADEKNPNNKIGTTELWELRQSLEQGPKLDYIILDCCLMGNAETAYELRDVAHYMVASPAEIQGEGMPYKTVITRLSKCKSVKDLPEALDYCARSYFDEFNPYPGATVDLYDLSHVKSLADSYRQLIDSNRARLAEMDEANGPAIDKWTNNFQQYGREYSPDNLHYKYYYLDIDDVISWLGTNNPQAAEAAHKAVADIVLKEYHTDRFWDLHINHSCGMAVALPEVFHLADDHNLGYGRYFGNFRTATLQAAYHLTAWGSEMGY